MKYNDLVSLWNRFGCSRQRTYAEYDKQKMLVAARCAEFSGRLRGGVEVQLRRETISPSEIARAIAAWRPLTPSLCVAFCK